MKSCVKSRGRPRLNFDEASAKTKEKRVNEIVKNHNLEELRRAFNKISLSDKHDSNFSKNQIIHNDGHTENKKLLAMYVDLDLSKRKYEKMRVHNANIHGNKIYPPYYKIKAMKNECYPENFEVTETGASIDFISLLTHTTNQILNSLNPIEREKIKSEKLLFIGK